MQNYDSKGINTGLEIGSIFSRYESQLITNRKLILQQAIKASDFRAYVASRTDEYREANRKAAHATLKDVTALARQEIAKSYDVGINTVDTAMDDYKKQGYSPPVEPTNNNAVDMLKLIVMAQAISALGNILDYSQTSANNQLTAITYAINPQADNLNEEIDRAQQSYLKKGVAGSVAINGVEKEMTSEAEFIMRDQSHKALQAAQSERRKEYGNKYVLVSAHPSSCPLCVPWQGKILIDDRAGGTKEEGYELLSTAIRAGLGHYNCRHTWVDYIPGYTRTDLYDYDKASVKETAQRYAIEQQQRYNERAIREWKRRADGALLENNKLYAEYKVREWQARQRALRVISENKGLPFYRQYSREQLQGVTKPTISRFKTG